MRPFGYEPNELPDCSTPRRNSLTGIEPATNGLGNRGSSSELQGGTPRVLPLH